MKPSRMKNCPEGILLSLRKSSNGLNNGNENRQSKRELGGREAGRRSIDNTDEG